MPEVISVLVNASRNFQWYPVAITNEMFIWKGRKYKCASGLSSRALAA